MKSPIFILFFILGFISQSDATTTILECGKPSLRNEICISHELETSSFTLLRFNKNSGSSSPVKLTRKVKLILDGDRIVAASEVYTGVDIKKKQRTSYRIVVYQSNYQDPRTRMAWYMENEHRSPSFLLLKQ